MEARPCLPGGSARRPRVAGARFALALADYALLRFGIELLRRNRRFGPFTRAQWTCLALGAVALRWIQRSGRLARPSTGSSTSNLASLTLP